MPDLTIENYWVCEPYAEWAQASPRFRKAAGLVKPACSWNEYNDGGEPAKDGEGHKVCPRCGGRLTVVKYGV